MRKSVTARKVGFLGHKTEVTVTGTTDQGTEYQAKAVHKDADKATAEAIKVAQQAEKF